MADLYVPAGGGTWDGVTNCFATTTGGAASVAATTAADNIFYDANSGGTLAYSGNQACRSFQWSKTSGTFTHAASSTLSIGDGTAGTGNIALQFMSGMTYTRSSQTTSAIAFVSSSATQQTVDWAGKQTSNINFNGTGSWKVITTTSAVWTMNGSSSGSFTHTKGTVDLNGCDLRTGVYTTAFANTRSITFNGAVISCSNTGNAFNFNSGLAQLTKVDSPTSVTLTGNGSTTFLGGLDWSATTFIFSSTAHTISGGSGLTTAVMGELRRIAGSGTLNFSSGTVVGINTLTVTGPRTISFLSGATYNITTWAASGTAGNLVTIASSTPASPHTLSKTSGRVIVDYLSLTDSTATGGATFYAGSHSTASNSAGWIVKDERQIASARSAATSRTAIGTRTAATARTAVRS